MFCVEYMARPSLRGYPLVADKSPRKRAFAFLEAEIFDAQQPVRLRAMGVK